MRPTNGAGLSAGPALLIASAVVATPLVLKLSRAPSVSPPRVTAGTCTERAAPADPHCAGPRSGNGGTAAGEHALPRFVDLGTTTCAPCRVMLGVMDELRRDYPGAMVVEFVNVQETPAEGERYGVQIIPTQIFFSPDGRELFRHVGVFRTAEVVAKWAELGFPLAAMARN